MEHYSKLTDEIVTTTYEELIHNLKPFNYVNLFSNMSTPKMQNKLHFRLPKCNLFCILARNYVDYLTKSKTKM